MNKLKVLTLSSVLTVLAASCDLSTAAENGRLQLTGRSGSSINMPLPRSLERPEDSLTELQTGRRQ